MLLNRLFPSSLYLEVKASSKQAATTIGQVVEKLFSLMESVTNVTNVTNDTILIPVSSGDIAVALNMTPQAVGQILKTLGLQTSLHKVEGNPKRCIIFNQVRLDTLKKRYIPLEDDELVTTVTTPVDSINNVTESTSGSIYPTPEAVLGMSVEKTIEVWYREGAPVIQLGTSENCLDLSKLLSHPDVPEHHLEAVKAWLQKRMTPDCHLVSFEG